MHVYVCNGDADGLCALQQLRRAQPGAAAVVTGRKREIALLDRAKAAAGDRVTVLDVSLAANRDALLRLLARGVEVRYFDHHEAGDVPVHPRLVAHVDGSPATCTSLIVDAVLGAAQRRWALVGAWGDGLDDVAGALAEASGLCAAERVALREIGIDINYNAYGDSDDDLVVTPAALAAHLEPLDDPRALADDTVLLRIRAARRQDSARALAQPVEQAGSHARYVVLPDAPWSRRVRGTLAYELARGDPARAAAVLSVSASGDYVVSVRAPLAARRGADALCRRFGGSGRSAAAGIDRLAAADFDTFVAALASAFVPAGSR